MGIPFDPDLAYNYVRLLLPDEAEILCLSNTGSRAFGWGGDKYDVDIRGMFAYSGWWCTMHIGRNLYDLNMMELWTACRRAKEAWTFQEDISNAFYVHPDFDYQGMKDFCGPQHVRRQLYSITSEIARLKRGNTRAALHCYRVAMEPLHFLRTGDLIINTIDMNNRHYGFEQMNILKDKYLHKGEKKADWKQIFEDIHWLEAELKTELESITEDEFAFDEETFDTWRDGQFKKFYTDRPAIPKPIYKAT